MQPGLTDRQKLALARATARGYGVRLRRPTARHRQQCPVPKGCTLTHVIVTPTGLCICVIDCVTYLRYDRCAS